uniref:Ppp2r3a protein n=1 Tax=Xenopus tropicalis TaxID=8364 RepID=A4II77_XENTR|nr:ppp2r3a protein [Xenopus tropicalis]
MMIKETSLRRDPDLRGELAFLARGCDFVLPSRFKKRIKSFQQAQIQSKQEKKPNTPPPVPLTPTASPRPATPPLPSNKATAPVSINIPRFYFPKGLPNPGSDYEDSIKKTEAAFSSMEEEKADIYEMGKIAKVCGCPLYWKAALFNAAGGERTGFVSVHSFIAMWRKLIQNCHDDAPKFISLLAKPGCDYLEQEDFIPLLQDIVDTHPGLTFLKEAPEFHSRYITTVIQRIFYTVNRSWSGRITLTELRRSNFLQTLALLEEEDDINQVTDYFSYEHFYVIYCKFWELDTDHDLYIDQKDLGRYNDHASSKRIIERIFSGAVTRGNAVQGGGRMEDTDSISFLMDIKTFIDKCQEQQRAVVSTGNTLLSKELCQGTFKGPIQYIMWKELKSLVVPSLTPMLLDPNSAHPNLHLSEGLTSVRYGENKLSLPDNAKRFSQCILVLGSQGFESGRHYWEVEVGDKTAWDVGMASESSNRKGKIKLNPKNGYWAIWLRNGNAYKALESPSKALTLASHPRKIGVYVDYEGGQISFYNADDMTSIYTFSATFTEKLYPYLSPFLHDGGKNVDALRFVHN